MALTVVPNAANAGAARWQVGERLLSDAAPHSHIVQFYEDSAFLVDAVTVYVAAGLRASEPAVVVATAAHRDALVTALKASDIDVDSFCRSGHLTLLDAHETLSRLLVDGRPDAGLFKSVVGAALERAHEAGGDANIRAFGEMVDLLWRDGNRRAALDLEELWNDLARRHSFSLLCGYVMDNFRQGEHAALFEEVCNAHSHVIPTETYARIEDSDSRLREVSLLQQRARALETEIAQRKDVERALREAVKVRDEFLSIASHELKTPLTTIHLQVQSLLRLIEDDSEPRIGPRLARTARNVDRIAGLVEQLLDVSRLGAGPLLLETSLVDLTAVARDAVEQLADEAERADCQIRVNDGPPVHGSWDRRRLIQVTVNLLSNAIKYGGKQVDVVVEAVGSKARLTVRDHGIGISASDQRRVFERFERAVPPEHYGGLGLGLWIVRHVVEAHSGTVRLQSELGHGATFVVELPLRP